MTRALLIPFLMLAACNSLDTVDPVSTDECDVDQQPAACPGAELRGAMLEGRKLTLASFVQADLRDANLRGATLWGADFTGADLTGADLTGALVNMEPGSQNGNVAGTAFDGVTWLHTICPDGTSSTANGGTCGGHLVPPPAGECNIEDDDAVEDRVGEDAAAACGWCDIKPQADCTFSRNVERDLRWASLVGADLRASEFGDADMTDADLRGTNLRGAHFRQTKLDNVLWEAAICPDGAVADAVGGTCGGHLDPMGFQECRTPALNENGEPDPDGPSTVGPGPMADCAGAFLPSADLRWAQMPGACFQQAQIVIAEISDADLTGADFRGAHLDRVEFEDTDLTGAIFGDYDAEAAPNPLCGAVVMGPTSLALTDVTWENTICPDGTLSTDNGMTCGGHLDPVTAQACDAKPEAVCPQAMLEGAELRAANLYEATLTRAMLAEANLSDSILEGADLQAADLTGADLSRANADEGFFESATLDGVQAQQATFRNAQFPRASGGEILVDGKRTGANFSGADMSNALFGGVRFTNASFVATRLADADFNRACLDRSNLSGADLSRAQLRGTSMKDALLIDATINGANLSEGCLADAGLQGLQAHEATLQWVDATQADLTGAVLVGANWGLGRLHDANFTQAVLRDADFSGADLSGALLGGADLSGADMRCADLTGVSVTRRTRIDDLDIRGAIGAEEFIALLEDVGVDTSELEDSDREEAVNCSERMRPSTCDCECGQCPGGM